MPSIDISAVITDGAAVLFLAASDGATASELRLPRCAFGGEADSIEDALAAHLRRTLGIIVTEQEFVETVYERPPGATGVRLNNVQLVTAWEGAPLADASGAVPSWVPLAFVADVDLPSALRPVVLAALGISTALQAGGAPAETGAAIFITGPAGVGKSTVARLIADRRERAALVPLDGLMDLVVRGAPERHWHGGDEAVSRAHLRLVLANAAALAQNFSRAGFDCVIEGVLENPDELDTLLGGLAGIGVYFVTLVAEPDELARRDQSRAPEQRMGARSLELHGLFQTNGELRGLRVDSSRFGPEETAELILERLSDARLYP